MAPHLTAGELDLITHCLGKNQEPKEIQRVLNARRQAKRIETLKIWAIRRACRGVTHQRGRSDGRGKKQSMTAAQVDRLNETRKRLLAKAKTEYEVPYHAILKSARLGVHRTTAARHLKSKHGVEWRRIREKPPRSKEHVDERKDVACVWKRKPKTFWTKEVDLIIDCKKFHIPTSKAAAARLRSQKVRGSLRDRGEGLQPGFTKPNARKHKFNAGGHVHVLAGTCGDRFVVWEEIHGRWNSKKAEEMYTGPIKKALQKHRPGKRSWLVMEDNDPAGFKSNRGKDAKRATKIRTLDQPRYSPDLNPLDYSLWSAIHDKALKEFTGGDTIDAYKKKLRRIALRMPRKDVRLAVEQIKKRAQAIFEANGDNIARD